MFELTKCRALRLLRTSKNYNQVFVLTICIPIGLSLLSDLLQNFPVLQQHQTIPRSGGFEPVETSHIEEETIISLNGDLSLVTYHGREKQLT